MLRYAVIFFIIAIIAAVFGFGGIAVASVVNAVRTVFAGDPGAHDHTDTEHMT